MKKSIFIFLIIFALMPLQAVSADWASSFVVYSNDIYEITDEPILPNVIEKKIGHVTHYSDEEGTYRGNFSNTFPKGTAYYSIKNTNAKVAIAIETKPDTYVKAMNKGHYDNNNVESRYLIRKYTIIAALLLAGIILIKRLINRKKSL